MSSTRQSGTAAQVQRVNGLESVVSTMFTFGRDQPIELSLRLNSGSRLSGWTTFEQWAQGEDWSPSEPDAA